MAPSTRNLVAEKLFPAKYYYPLMIFDVVSRSVL